MDRVFSRRNFATLAPLLIERMPVDYVVECIVEMAEDESLDGERRRLAADYLISLVEVWESEFPARFVSRLFAVLMTMLLDVEEDDTSSHFAMGCLNDLANALDGNTVFPVASEQLAAYLAAPEWPKHHAALVALVQISQGCSKVMIKNSKQVVTMVLNSFHHPHPRVRWAAIDAIEELSKYLRPHLQLQYHDRVLPALASAMDDFENPGVQEHATSAMIKFSQDCTPDIWTPYLDGMVSKLLVLLQSGTQMVQERALTALESVAHKSSEEQFQKYYDEVMPCLKAILVNKKTKANLMLRAKAMEFICLVGMAVEKDKFRDDAKQVMEVLMSLQGAQTETDDPTTCYMLRAGGRLCKCLGRDFLPYMAVVMPPLLQSAQHEHGSIEERATTCKVLCCIADDLKEGFFPWIDQVAPTLLPLLKSVRQVRKSAVSAMPGLLRSSKLAIEKGLAQGTYLKQLSDCVVPALVEALHKELDTEIIADMLDALCECLQICGPFVDDNQVRSIVDEIKHVITASSTRRRRPFWTKIKEGNEQEKQVYYQVGAVLETLVKAFDASFFDELSSYLMPMLGKDKTAEERIVALCIFDNVAQQCREAALRFYDTYLPFLLEACNDENPDVRQEAVYGVGVCAEYGGSAIKPLIGEALSSLYAVIRHPDALHPDKVMAYDNAVSALGKICHFQRDNIDSAQVIPAWLNCLPIKGDVVEAKAVHELLSVMVERRDAELLGPNNQYLPKIVSIFTEILCAGKNLASDQTISRISNLLSHNFGWGVSCVPDIQQPWMGCFG